MNYIKYIVVLCVFFAACKGDSIAKTPSEGSTTAPQATVSQPQSQVKKVEPKSQLKMDTVQISNLIDLVDNAKSNSVVMLAKGTYKLEKDLVYYMTKDERRIIDKTKENTQSIGGQLYFSGLNNFHIIGEKGTNIISANPKAIPFFIRKGDNIKISNLTIKKNIKGKADLSYISNSTNVLVEKCIFDGGGTYGMYANMVKKMKVNSCIISNCTNGAVRINESTDLTFNNSTFTKNTCTVPVFNMYGGGSIATLNGVNIIGNKKDTNSNFQGSEYIFRISNNIITLNNCVIRDNTGFQKLGVSPNSMQRTEVNGVDL